MQTDYAIEIHDRYAQQVGSEQIASLISIQTLVELLETKKPNQILELGAGIGTLTQVCLQKSSGMLTSVENNEWCIDRLRKNMLDFRKFSLVTKYQLLDLGSEADFLIIDANNGIYNVEKLIINSPHLSTVFIEGHHLAHRLNISRTLNKLGKRQTLFDVRASRGKKGCAYFEIHENYSKQGWKVTIDFIRTITPLKLSFYAVKFRGAVGFTFNKFEKIPGFSSLRKIWKGKIPWQF